MTEQHIRDYNDLYSCMKEYGGNYDYDMVKRAFERCVTAHEGQKRLSNEDYYIHPLNVAKIIISLGLDSQSIAAALLHDVVEDTEATADDIKQEFGAEVALLVDGVTRINKLNFSTKEQEQAESLRKMLIAMGQDKQVLATACVLLTRNNVINRLKHLKFMPLLRID